MADLTIGAVNNQTPVSQSVKQNFVQLPSGSIFDTTQIQSISEDKKSHPLSNMNGAKYCETHLKNNNKNDDANIVYSYKPDCDALRQELLKNK